jgi:hypothetical protein
MEGIQGSRRIVAAVGISRPAGPGSTPGGGRLGSPIVTIIMMAPPFNQITAPRV